MIILTLEQLLEIHALIIEFTKGSSGLRDLGRLESVIATQTQNIFDEELYPSIINKAAAMIRSIIADHPFVDGNKRTAMLAGLILLEINKIKLTITSEEIEDFAIEISIHHLDVTKISNWIQKHII